MNATALAPCNLMHYQRRAEVRRLFYRHRLSMLEIARRLGISKPTVWRDLRWLAQHRPEPTDPLEALNREIEDAKEEAWRAYARSLEPVELETETIRTSPEAASRASHVIKRVRKTGAGDVRYLKLIGDLIEKQVKLFHAIKARKTSHEAGAVVSAVPNLKPVETNMKRFVTLRNAAEPALNRSVPANLQPCSQENRIAKVVPLSQPQRAVTSEDAAVPILKRDETEMKRSETVLERDVTAGDHQKVPNLPVSAQTSRPQRIVIPFPNQLLSRPARLEQAA